MQKTLLMLLAVVMEWFSSGYLFFSLLHRRYSKKASFVIFTVLMVVSGVKHFLLFDHMSLRTTLEWAILLTALFTLFTDSVWKKLGVFALYGSEAVIIETVSMVVSSALLHRNVFQDQTLSQPGTGIAYAFDVLAITLANVITVQILKRKKDTIDSKVLRFIVIYFFMQTLTIFILWMILWDYQIQAVPVMITGFLMVALSVAFGIMLYRMMRASIAEKAKADRMAMQMELANEHFGRLQVQYEQYRRLRHDYYNHIKTIRAMKDADARDTYIAGLTEQIENLNGVTFCTNAALDALLFNEKTQADALGVRTDFKIADIDGLRIPDIDICTVVSNLLDNAIRGAAEAPGEPFVSASVFVRAGQLLISVKNSCKAPNDTLKTTKPQKTEHGLGLNIVRDIAKKYDGAVAHSYENGVFSYTVSMSI